MAPVSRAAPRCLVGPGSRTTEYLVMPSRVAPLVADERMWTRNLRAAAHVLGLRMIRPPIERGTVHSVSETLRYLSHCADFEDEQQSRQRALPPGFSRLTTMSNTACCGDN
jgi:hypothetical protein